MHVCNSNPSLLHPHTTHSRTAFKQDFSKTYENKSEHKHREAVFNKNKANIIHHNSLLGTSYKKGINEFTDLEDHEGNFGYSKTDHPAYGGGSKRRHLTRDELPFDVDPIDQLPASVDWREKGVVTAVKDQGGCGSCWAFAATACLESHIAIETDYLFNLAPQEFVSCMPNPNECGGTGGCQGSIVDLAYDYAIEHGGLVSEFQMGYSSYYGENGNCTIHPEENKNLRGTSTGGPDPDGVSGGVVNIEDYANLPTNDYLSLMNAIAKTGPVAVSVAASPWKSYESGVFQMDGGFTEDNLDVNHAVVMVGYGTDEDTGLDYFLIRNSWKPTWAEHGYIRLLRTDPDSLDDPDTNCGMDTKPQDGTGCKGDTDPVKVCGTSAILFDNLIPLGGHLLQ